MISSHIESNQAGGGGGGGIADRVVTYASTFHQNYASFGAGSAIWGMRSVDATNSRFIGRATQCYSSLIGVGTLDSDPERTPEHLVVTGSFFALNDRIVNVNRCEALHYMSVSSESARKSRINVSHSTLNGGQMSHALHVRADGAMITVSNSIMMDFGRVITGYSYYTPSVISFRSVISHNINALAEVVNVADASGLINADPRLASDGYHLLPDSPAIDAGVPGAPSTDIDGQYRPQRGAPDIGADEFYDAVALDDLNVVCPPSSNGLTAIDAQASPANASRPVTYTVSTADEPPRLYTGWSSATLGVGWALPGAKTVTITATNPHGSIARNCAVNVSAPARAVWVPVLER